MILCGKCPGAKVTSFGLTFSLTSVPWLNCNHPESPESHHFEKIKIYFKKGRGLFIGFFVLLKNILCPSPSFGDSGDSDLTLSRFDSLSHTESRLSHVIQSGLAKLNRDPMILCGTGTKVTSFGSTFSLTSIPWLN